MTQLITSDYVPISTQPIAWFNASDMSTVIKSGTNRLSRWRDKSGNGNDAIQNNGSNQPTWTAAQQNGLPTIVFNGTQLLGGPSGLYTICNGDNAVFVVAKRDTEAATQNSIMAIYRSGIATGLRMDFSATAGNINFQNSDASPATSTGNTNTNYNVITGRREGTLEGISVNGGVEVTTASATSYASSLSFDIGMQNGSFLLTGGIGEMIFFNAALSLDDIQTLKLILKAKWGTP